jgi:predicted metalloendopeptidase
MDYGAIGAVIGHEISHSFDDQGRCLMQAAGCRTGGPRQTSRTFRPQCKRLAEQFDAYRPFPDIHVNGEQTLSENIADVAGLSDAYDAWRLTLEGKPPTGADGFSADQMFFLSFAQSWRQKVREPALRQRIVTDGHAPDQYPADTVRNLDAWYAAFDVKPGAKLPPAPSGCAW